MKTGEFGKHVGALIASLTVFCVLCVAVTVTYGTSAIDDTQPVASSAASSTPIRGNFAAAKSEISALQAKFASSSQDNGIVRFDGSGGALQNDLYCTISDQGVLACDVNYSGTAMTVLQRGAGGLFSASNHSTSAGLQIGNDGGTSILTTVTGTKGIEVISQGASSKPLFVQAGDGSYGTPYFSVYGGSATPLGMCLRTAKSGDDPQTCWVQDKATIAATTGTVQTITLEADKVYFIRTRVMGRCTAGANCTVGQGAVFETFGAWRLVTGSATVIQGVQEIYTAEDDAADTYCTQVGSGADVLVQCETAAGVTYVFASTAEISTGS